MVQARTIETWQPGASEGGTVAARARALPLVRRASDIRLALFSGNFNYTADGANMTLNKLAAFLQREGVQVRVYSPTSATPAFEPAAPLVSVPSLAFPGRGDYRVGLGLSPAVRADLAEFAPNLVHLSAPDILGHAALRWARRRDLPVIASFHTRFETYFRYYGLGWLEPVIKRAMDRFYGRADRVLAPAEPIAAMIRADSAADVRLWARGVDRNRFTPALRSAAWRLRHGLSADVPLIGFVGRLVREKGLGMLAEVARGLKDAAVPHKLVIVGDGPERRWLEGELPDALFLGFQSGAALAETYANLDIFYNPSTTETFGNVTLEALASGVAVVAVRATGAESIVVDGKTGLLVDGLAAQPSIASLRMLSQDAQQREQMRLAARQHSARFSWEEILQGVLDNYLDVMART
jgi:phosphatidylinositol alpha 1,6-mannosyltransferase